MSVSPDRPKPLPPKSVADAGLPESLLEQLVLKILYFRGELYGQDLSQAIALKYSVIEDIVEGLKLQHLIQVKRSLGMSGVGSLLALTESGRARAREALEFNQCSGPAPVPLEQYTEIVRTQRPRQGWLTRQALMKALRGMVVTEHLISQVGPAVSSAKSLLLYGKPGDGKTFLIESLQNLESTPIFVPHAIECQGKIIQVFDPIYHRQIEEEAPPSIMAVAHDSSHDARWVECRRPFIVTGGELSPDMLDLRYNVNSKVYEAPFQLKANNGIYLIDDFGRQRATPAEVLNRWIVPMERKVDYLTFLTGGKMTVPFECFLVFSTNLNPNDLGDEAFLRRIQYKMLLRGPSEDEFIRIFENVCAEHELVVNDNVLPEFLERHYRHTGKALRRCHPRDLLFHAINLMECEKLPHRIDSQILERAYESCFVAEEQEADGVASPIVYEPVQPCSAYLAARIQPIATVFGRLAAVASYRDRDSNQYRCPDAPRVYLPAEIDMCLASLHTRTFREWLRLGLPEQTADLARFMATPEGRATFLSFSRRDLPVMLAPPSLAPQEVDLFGSDLSTILTTLAQRPTTTTAKESAIPELWPLEQIA